MKTKLIFPPFWTVTQPYLSVPSLAAYLQKYGKTVEQVDLNLEVYDYILSKEFFSKCSDRLGKRLGQEDTSRQEIETYEILNYLQRHVEEYKDTFRSKKALDINIYKRCAQFLKICFKTLTNLYTNERISFYSYTNENYNEEKSEDIIKCMEDARNQKLADCLLVDVMKPFIENISTDCDLIGISLTGGNQILATFILAALIKQKNPKVKIMIGGNIITRWIEPLTKIPEFFNYVDYYMYGEGEYPLKVLVDALEGNLSIENIPNIVYQNKDGKIVVNEDNCYRSIDELPTPVFNQKYIKRYFSPSIVMPLLASRGCFWGKCAFCDHSYTYHGKYRCRDINMVIKDIKTLQKEYGCEAINFHDEAIAPVEMEELSERLLDEKITIKWSTCARLDHAMSEKVLKKAYQSGLSVLFFGLESINQRVLQKMNKGTRTDNIKNILNISASVGIWNHLFFICGFPTETKEEFQETLDFVQNNQDYIHSSGCSFFTLGRFSNVYFHPDQYDVLVKDTPNDMSLYCNYETLYDEKERREFFEEHYGNFSRGKFEYATKWLFRDHWLLFLDYLQQEKKEVTIHENKISLKETVYWEVYGEKLQIYDFLQERIKIVKLPAKYSMILSSIESDIPKDIIIKEIAEQYDMTQEDAISVFEAFCKVLTQYELIDNT